MRKVCRKQKNEGGFNDEKGSCNIVNNDYGI